MEYRRNKIKILSKAIQRKENNCSTEMTKNNYLEEEFNLQKKT